METTIENLIDGQTNRIRHEINRLAYETAEKQGMSIWDVVSRYYPEVRCSEPLIRNVGDRMDVTMEAVISLKPYPVQTVSKDEAIQAQIRLLWEG